MREKITICGSASPLRTGTWKFLGASKILPVVSSSGIGEIVTAGIDGVKDFELKFCRCLRVLQL